MMGSPFSIQGALFGQSKQKQPPEKPAELTAEQMRQAVERLRAEVQAGLDDGTICPCCDKYVRRYRRKLNASMARSLIWLVRESERSPDGWVDVPSRAPRWLVRTNQLATVRLWGFIERAKTNEDVKHSGQWRPTPEGVRFAYDRTTAPEAVVTYNGDPVGFEGSQVSIADALGRKFSYFELMGFDEE